MFPKLIRICLLVFILAGCRTTRLSYPDDQNFRMAEASFLKGEYQIAIDNYILFISGQPLSVYVSEAYYRTGISYLAMDNVKEALPYLKESLNRAKYTDLRTQVLNSLGFLYFVQQNYAEAIKHYELALKGNKAILPIAEVYYNTGVSFMRTNHWREGRKYIQLAKDAAGKNERIISESATERLSLPPDTFVVQLGKFDNKDNAQAYQSEVLSEKGLKVTVNIILIEGNEFFYLWAGSFPTYQEAVARAEEIRECGLEAVVMP
ncbi:MAG: tetratricopeptide repeat protein [Candidatus Brocadiia bacterium]